MDQPLKSVSFMVTSDGRSETEAKTRAAITKDGLNTLIIDSGEYIEVVEIAPEITSPVLIDTYRKKSSKEIGHRVSNDIDAGDQRYGFQITRLQVQFTIRPFGSKSPGVEILQRYGCRRSAKKQWQTIESTNCV